MVFRSLVGTVGVLILSLSACTPSPSPQAVTATGALVSDPTPLTAAYKAWVLNEADTFVVKTEAFVAAVLAGDRALAQSLYAPSRMPFERIEPVAEVLGDFDPRIDAREGDVPAESWGGFHRIEKVLWSSEAVSLAVPAAKALLADVHLLRGQLETAEITLPLMVAGSVELLNEVSSSKVTGEEERYSHTDLWDFAANVEGARQIWLILAPAVRTADPSLATTLDGRFASLQALLEAQSKGGVYRPYNELAAAEVKALATAVDALAEPLAQLGKHFPSE